MFSIELIRSSPLTVALGFQDQKIRIIELILDQSTNLVKIAQKTVIDHKLRIQKPVVAINFVQNNFLLATIDGVGMFKWLYYDSQTAETLSDSACLKLLPVTKGFHIHSVLLVQN